MKMTIRLAVLAVLVVSGCRITPIGSRCTASGSDREGKKLLPLLIGTWENHKAGNEKIILVISDPKSDYVPYDLTVVCRSFYSNGETTRDNKASECDTLPLGISLFQGEKKKYVNISFSVISTIGASQEGDDPYAWEMLNMLYPLNYLAEIQFDTPDRITVRSVELTRDDGREPVDEAIRMETTDGFTVIVNSPDEIMELLNAGKYISNYQETFYRVQP